MKRFVLLIIYSSLLHIMNAQVSCDSVSLGHDTINVHQPTDTSVMVKYIYSATPNTGYSFVSFEFPDTTHITIHSQYVTSGFPGPYEYEVPYFLTYNNPSIPPNTIVNANFKAYHPGTGQPPMPLLDCLIPVVFLINPAPTTGIKEETKFDIGVFPNPCTDYLFLEISELPEPQASLSITNIIGEHVIHTIVTTGMTRIDISQLAAGAYFATLQLKGQQIIKKIIKKN